MATIRRHPVPPDSYAPERPLNDLMHSQFEHFVHVARRLPPRLRADLREPSEHDVVGVNSFIAAVTERLMSTKRAPLRLVSKRARKSVAPTPIASVGIAIAAQAESPSPPAHPRQKREPSSPGSKKTRRQPK